MSESVEKDKNETMHLSGDVQLIPPHNTEYQQAKPRSRWNNTLHRLPFKFAIPNDQRRCRSVNNQHLINKHIEDIQESAKRSASQSVSLYAPSENQDIENGTTESYHNTRIRDLISTYPEIIGQIKDDPLAPITDVKLFGFHEEDAITDETYPEK